jgi:UDP-N-acetylmuramoylalanine--D-glutamate ligase
MELSGKRVLVVGLGQSGLAASRLCARKGAQVRAADMAKAGEKFPELDALGIAYNLGGHRREDFQWAEIIVLSPGVDMRRPEIQAARQGGARIIGEFGLAYEEIDCPCIMITGSNGKTTVSTLIAEILQAAGCRVFAGGNLGLPLSQLALSQGRPDWAVLEVSSFQTDTAEGFKPRIGVILNITPDHMDRYASFDDYAASKFKILARQEGPDLAVLCHDDAQVAARKHLAPAGSLLYGRDDCAAPQAAWLEGDMMRLRWAGQKMVEIDIAGCKLPGQFNRLNMLAAAGACLYAGVPSALIASVLKEFTGLPHRLQKVGEVKGVSYYDDSKGTNVGAVQAALQALGEPTILLLGGRDKDGDFHSLLPVLQNNTRLAICFGEAGPLIHRQLAAHFPCRLAPDLTAAVQLAQAEAGPDYAVLLSPGCASFDAYSGYAQRGEHFAALVYELQN